MNCQDITPLLALYGDGALESSDHLRVEGHLRECPACRKEVLALQQSWELLGEFDANDVESAAADLDRRTMIPTDYAAMPDAREPS